MNELKELDRFYIFYSNNKEELYEEELNSHNITKLATVEWTKGTSPSVSPKTGRESLDSSGSYRPADCRTSRQCANRYLTRYTHRVAIANNRIK